MKTDHHDMETYADMYNTCDAIEKLSKYYGTNCHEEMEKHAKKAFGGVIFTLGASLVGFLYTLWHHGWRMSFGAAEDVYHKYDNLVEDCDRFEDEWLDIVKKKKE